MGPPRWLLAAFAGPAAVLVATILVLTAVEFRAGQRSPALGDEQLPSAATSSLAADPLDATRRVTRLAPTVVSDDGRSVRATVALDDVASRALGAAEAVELAFDHRVPGSGAAFEVAVVGGGAVTVESSAQLSPTAQRMSVDLQSLVGGFGITSFDIVITSSVSPPAGSLLDNTRAPLSLVLGGPSTESFSSVVVLENIDACTQPQRVESALALDAVLAPIGQLASPGGYTPLALCWDPVGGSSLWRTRAAAGDAVLREPAALRYLDPNRTAAAGGAYYGYRIDGGSVFVLSGACEVLVCGPDSAQQRWFDEATSDLDQGCVIAYWSGTLDPDLERLVSSRVDFSVPGGFVATDALSETRVEVRDGAVRWSRASTGPVSSGTTNCRRGT